MSTQMKRLLPILILTALFATGCSTTFRTMREPNVRFELTGEDYTLTEDAVEGEATVVYVLGIDWKRLFGRSDRADFNTPVMGTLDIIKGAETYAIYDLMEKNPGYDFVMYPQVTKEFYRVLPFYSRVKVTVRARLGKLKNRGQ